MSKVFANTKLFAAAAILFAVATIFNVNMNASTSAAHGFGLKPAPVEPVVKIGPTFPPSPWDDEAPTVTAKTR